MLSGALSAREAALSNERKANKKLVKQQEQIAELQAEAGAAAERVAEAEAKMQNLDAHTDTRIQEAREQIEQEQQAAKDELLRQLNAEKQQRNHAETTVKIATERLHGEQETSLKMHRELSKAERAQRELDERLVAEQAAHALNQKYVNKQQCSKITLERELVRTSKRAEAEGRKSRAAELALHDEQSLRLELEEKLETMHAQLLEEQALREGAEQQRDQALVKAQETSMAFQRTEAQLQAATNQLTQFQAIKAELHSSEVNSATLALNMKQAELDSLREHVTSNANQKRESELRIRDLESALEHSEMRLREQAHLLAMHNAERFDSTHHLQAEIERLNAEAETTRTQLQDKHEHECRRLRETQKQLEHKCTILEQQWSEDQSKRDSVCSIANKVLTLQHVMDSRMKLHSASSPTSPLVQSTTTSPLTDYTTNWPQSPLHSPTYSSGYRPRP